MTFKLLSVSEDNNIGLPGSPQMVIAIRRAPISRAEFNEATYTK